MHNIKGSDFDFGSYLREQLKIVVILESHPVSVLDTFKRTISGEILSAHARDSHMVNHINERR